MGAPNGIGVLINKNRFGTFIQKLTTKTTDIKLTETNCHYFQNIAIPWYLQATVSVFVWSKVKFCAP